MLLHKRLPKREILQMLVNLPARIRDVTRTSQMIRVIKIPERLRGVSCTFHLPRRNLPTFARCQYLSVCTEEFKILYDTIKDPLAFET